MDHHAIVREIIEILEDLGSPERIEQSKHYFPTSMRVVGVTNPDIKAVIREIRDRYNDWNEKDWIALCKALVAEGIFECQVLAFEMIGRNKKLLGALEYKDLKALGQHLDNWASVDLYTVGIYGVLWSRGIVKDHHIDQLLQSDNHWERRIAVVSTVALNLKSRGGTGDTPRTLSVCVRVVDERHDMIQKALSWALRELSKGDRDAVLDFMDRYGERMAKRVVREVNHKLEFGTKN
jgi:3-methyladenine DNA glycosylase AlkD